MKEKIKQKINEIKGLKKYRPDKNSVCFDNGSELGWQIKPKKDKTEFNFEFDRNFENQNVRVFVEIGGEVQYFDSPSGIKDVVTKAKFGGTLKF